MFSWIRKRLTYANVALTLTLVFAMSGGAYAASRYVITSTKQISPKVLKSLKGTSGANGLAGPAGPAGAQGAQGSQGSQGPKGEPGPQGKEGPAGKNGENGKNGTTGFTKFLPEGETETGAWSALASAEGPILSPISFSIPLEKGLSEKQVHFVTSSEVDSHTSPAECPGSVEQPAAEAGNLCVYGGVYVFNIKFSSIRTVEGTPGASTAGAVLATEAGANEPRLAVGSWAVTAE
jgi:hypothetical protein